MRRGPRRSPPVNAESDAVGMSGAARRAGRDLEVVGGTEPLILPLRPSCVVGEAVVGDQQVAGQRIAD